MENKSFPYLTALFGNTPKTVGFKVHLTDCSMINTNGRKVSKCAVDAFTVVDMQERGYKVVFCKCCPKGTKEEVLAAAEAHGPTGQF